MNRLGWLLLTAALSWPAHRLSAQNNSASPYSASPRKIAVDRQRLCLTVDGKPFFPIGAYGITPEHMKECAEVGFNTTLKWAGNNAYGRNMAKRIANDGDEKVRAWMRAYLDAGQKGGLLVIDNPLAYSYTVLLNAPFDRPQFAEDLTTFTKDPLPRIVGNMKDHPALLGYYGFDEPWSNMSGAAREIMKAVKALDPNHPVMPAFAWAAQDWPDALEVNMSTGYFWPGARSLMHLYQQTLVNVAISHRNGQPFIHIPRMEPTDRARTDALLIPAMQKAQNYLALIAGANGVIWWHWPPRRADNWDAVKQNVAEIKMLSPALLEPPARTLVRHEPSRLSHTVQVRAIRHGNSTLLLTVNAVQTPVTVRFTLPAQVQGQAKVWFENREATIAGRQISDRFHGYERHIYEIPAQWPPEAEILLGVELGAMPVQPPDPGNRMRSAGNLLAGSFETQGAWRFERDTTATGQLSGRLDGAAPHSGRSCAMIEAQDVQGGGAWIGPSIQLKPNRRYTFGGWARSEMEGEVGPDAAIMFLGGKSGTMVWLSKLFVDDFGGWQRYSVSIFTDAGTFSVQPTFRISSALHKPDNRVRGKVWFDDLFLYEAPGVTRNLLINGGFEQSLATGWPRYWDCDNAYPNPGAVGGADPEWGMDSSKPYEGRYCLRLAGRQKAAPAFPFDPVNAEQEMMNARLYKDRDYVFSAYLRADREGREAYVRLGGYGIASEKFKLTTEWKRYFTTFRCKEYKMRPSVTIMLYDKEGTLWADAVQFEEGAKPTEYQEWKE